MKKCTNRILFLRPVLNTYGASKVLIQLACELKNSGHTIIVASDNNDRFKSQFQRMGIKHYTVPLRPDRKNIFYFLVCLIRLALIVRKEKIGIIHSHHRWSSFICFFVSKILRIPLVTTCHDIHQGKKLLTLLGDKIICVSEDIRKHLINNFNVNPHRIEVIHNGIKTPDLEKSLINLRRNAHPNSKRHPVIANIGRLSPEKDQGTLLFAMKKVVEQHPTVQLLIVGNGTSGNNLKKITKELDIEKNVEFVGEVDNINGILKKIDALVLSSLTEGFPISILEAFSFEKPVVATNVGDIPEIISDRKTGCLVPPKDPEGLANAINFLITNRDAAIKMGQNGKELVSQKFNVKRMALETEKVYLSLLSAGN